MAAVVSSCPYYVAASSKGYKTHWNLGEEACTDCKSAKANYMRKYRQSNPEAAKHNRTKLKAYNRAEARLRERHRNEFDEIYREECIRAGLQLEEAP